MKYYIDTCIWIDFIEGKGYAEDVFLKIIEDEDIVLISKLISKEFFRYKEYRGISSVMALLESKGLIEYVLTSDYQEQEALSLSKIRDIPRPDALHAIHARDYGAVLLTKDKHFLELKDICKVRLL